MPHDAMLLWAGLFFLLAGGLLFTLVFLLRQRVKELEWDARGIAKDFRVLDTKLDTTLSDLRAIRAVLDGNGQTNGLKREVRALREFRHETANRLMASELRLKQLERWAQGGEGPFRALGGGE